MNTIEILNQYLHAAERRLRMFALSRGAAVTVLVALGLTVVLAFVANIFTFSPAVVFLSRLLLFVSLAVAIAFFGVVPLLGLNRRNAARRVEAEYPQFEQRLLTFAECRDEKENPFIELLAKETAEVAERAEAERVAPSRALWTWLASGAGAAGLLLWLILAGPGYLGYGASLLWAGPPKAGSQPLYQIIVSPGDQTVRRRSDQLITARLLGFDTRNVRLVAKFRGSSKWEEVAMQPQPGGDAYEFLFAALPDSVEYYVEARGIRSKNHTISVIDLPGIKGFRVTYHYPGWTGLKDSVEDPGGDLRAVEGTVAELTVETDAPMKTGVVALDDETRIPLTGEGTTLKASVPIQKDGMYHFAALERDKTVRLSEDYFIEARKDSPPMVKLIRPGRDAKVNPIEEVPLAVEAEDDFGLQDVVLHYAVNGGEEKTLDVTGRKGSRRIEGKALLALEDFKLVPGDVVAVYATARDARTSSKTDIYFIEAQPFEREYSQSQQAGGGGGGDLERNERQEQRCRLRRECAVPHGSAVETARPGGVDVAARQEPCAGRCQPGVSKLREEHGRGGEGDVGGRRQAEGAELEGCAGAGAARVAACAASRIGVPPDSSRLRTPGRRRWRRRGGARPRQPLRSRTRYREEPVRDGAADRFRRAA
jgi:hypothetical protein